MDNLRNNEVDFALVSVIPDQIEVEEEVLLSNKLYLVGKTKAFDNEVPLIYREEGSATRGAMTKYFESPEKRKSIELTSNEAVKQAVLAGLGYSILPVIGMHNEIKNEDLHIIPSKGLPLETYWRLIWLKSKKLSPIATEYLNYIRNEKANIVEDHFGWYADF
jgi:DNA-binding transcriptional LysR family regulator